MESAGTDSRLD